MAPNVLSAVSKIEQAVLVKYPHGVMISRHNEKLLWCQESQLPRVIISCFLLLCAEALYDSNHIKTSLPRRNLPSVNTNVIPH